MGDYYSALQMHIDEEEKKSARRLLRRLRIALLIWLVCFLLALIWFSFSALKGF